MATQKNIFVFDGDEANCRLTANLLQGAGYSVRATSDYTKAVTYVTQYPKKIDLVVTDLLMKPNPSGHTDTILLAKACQTFGVDVIIVTNEDGREVERARAELGNEVPIYGYQGELKYAHVVDDVRKTLEGATTSVEVE